MDARNVEHSSPDYERPDENVADLKRPVTLPMKMARQGETSGHVRRVLYYGLALAVVLMALGYVLFY